MKIGFTISLGKGSYEFMKIESSELDDKLDALREVHDALLVIDHIEVRRFTNSSIFNSVR